jgi:hypothetical protein
MEEEKTLTEEVSSFCAEFFAPSYYYNKIKLPITQPKNKFGNRL